MIGGEEGSVFGKKEKKKGRDCYSLTLREAMVSYLVL